MKCNIKGYTLTEFLIASAITLLVILTMINFFIQGNSMLYTGCLTTWGQQTANTVSEKVGSLVRPAFNIEVFKEYKSNPDVSDVGNYLKIYSDDITSAFYTVNSKLYFVYDTTSDDEDTINDDEVIASNINNTNNFRINGTRLFVKFDYMYPNSTNKKVLSSEVIYEPRNFK